MFSSAGGSPILGLKPVPLVTDIYDVPSKQSTEKATRTPERPGFKPILCLSRTAQANQPL